jgi:hypothetical protein
MEAYFAKSATPEHDFFALVLKVSLSLSLSLSLC